MIERTFCHLPRIGLRSEQTLWEHGISDWTTFLSKKQVPRIARHRKPYFDRTIQESQAALHAGDSKYFLSLPNNQMWRLWNTFGTEALFVDIETDHRFDITVLGITDGERVWQFVKGHNEDRRDVKKVFSQAKLIITFNGASFDLPIIRRQYGDVLPDVPHIDLRHAGARAGLHGGLKLIERELGIGRDDSVDGVTGADAIALWHLYRHTGDRRHLDILLQYNEEDIVNLKPLADIIYKRLLGHY